MTEHVQIELITSATQIGLIALAIWRAEMAAKRAQMANVAAVGANTAAVKANEAAVRVGEIATEARAEQARASEQIHEAVNGGMKSAKAEIADLREQLIVAKAADAEPPVTAAARQEERRDK
jgi:hypothetical protein